MAYVCTVLHQTSLAIATVFACDVGTAQVHLVCSFSEIGMLNVAAVCQAPDAQRWGLLVYAAAV